MMNQQRTEQNRAIQKILQEFNRRRLLVIGDVMLDEYVWGKARRISPEAPVPVVEVERRDYAAGGAANTAANISGLGACPKLIGVIGNDFYTPILRKEFTRSGISDEYLITETDRPTIVKTRIVASKQHIVRVDVEERKSYSPATEKQICEKYLALLPESDLVIISDYGKGLISNHLSSFIIDKARSSGKKIIVDPKGDSYEKYRHASIITPNIQEAEQALKRQLQSEEEMINAGADLNKIIDGEAILLTRGAEGMTFFPRKGESVSVRARARNLFDVTGAGDTVVAALSLALSSGADITTAIQIANYAAGLVVEKIGTSALRFEELDELFR